jgi:hypothetical protein
MDINIKRPLQLGAPAGGETGWIVVEAQDGQHRLSFAPDTATDLILALQQAKQAIHAERKKAGKPPLETTYVKEVQQIEYGADALNQVALLRTRFKDGSSQELPLSRKQAQDIAKFLADAEQKFQEQDASQRQ